MNCSVYGETSPVILNAPAMTDTSIPGYRSALQNPDLSRAQLGALLRRRSPASLPAGERRAFWQSFTSYYATTHANSNE